MYTITTKLKKLENEIRRLRVRLETGQYVSMNEIRPVIRSLGEFLADSYFLSVVKRYSPSWYMFVYLAADRLRKF